MSTFKKGDRVRYHEEDAFENEDALGTVIKVIEHKTYEYEVEWDDDAPTDLYFDDQLAADSGLEKVA